MWPDGKKHSRNVYAKTREECEEKLKVLILEMRAEITALRSGASTEYPDGVSPKKEGHRRLFAGAPRRIQQVLNCQRIEDRSFYGTAVL